jgi:ribonuclease P protein component
MSSFSFRKDERLSGKKHVDRLFRTGSSFFVHPFKVYWLVIEEDSPYPAQAMIVVGKRSFKKATDRNRIRRQVRELYRQHKGELYDFLGKREKQCLIALIYSTSQPMEFNEMGRKINLVFRRLINEIEIHLNNNKRSLSDI